MKCLRFNRVIILMFLFLQLFVANITFAQTAPTASVMFPERYQSAIDVVYTKVDNWEGKLDVYYSNQNTKPMPVVIHIHGGGWNHGSKESQTGFSGWFKMGFAVVNIAYRLVDIAPAPAAIQDVRAAIHFVMTNAQKYNFDLSRIVMSGNSAGAHLALMGGLLSNKRIFDQQCDTEIDMRVAAIVSNYAPADFTNTNSEMSRFKSLVRWLGNKADDPVFRANVSPVTHINAQSPAVFIVHGDADPIVPYEQSVILFEKLKAHNVKSHFVTIKGGLHGKFEKADRDNIAHELKQFLQENNIIKD